MNSTYIAMQVRLETGRHCLVYVYINDTNKKESFSLQHKHKNYYTRPEIRSLRQSFVKAKALKQWMSSKQELSAAFYFSC